MQSPHIPVLLNEVLEHLKPQDKETYIDCTFGAGGYSRAILEAADCKVTAFDRDPSAAAAGAVLTKEFGERFRLNFQPFGHLLEQTQDDPQMLSAFDGVVFDLGVSSMQLDQPERGFSFQADGPLDMRMFSAPGQDDIENEPSAADIVNTYEADQLADIFYLFGEERRSRVIARAIVADRKEKPFETTKQLADLVARVLGGRRGEHKHPATRVFQALRIYVNDELGELVRGLAGAERSLKPGGRLVVVTFHSLEDRIVKRFLKSRSGRDGGQSRHLPELPATRQASFQIVNHRPLTSSEEEINANPRARSAVLRSAVRADTPAWPIDETPVGKAQIP